MLNKFASRENTLLERLERESRPIIIYGMGNGADKIMDICESRRIKITDIFASDEFVRGHSFRGYKVKTYSQITEQYKDAVILLAFAVFQDELIDRIYNIAKRYTLLIPDVPLFGAGLFDYDFLCANIDSIEKAYDLLADEQSKKAFVGVINFRLTGDPLLLKECETDRAEVFSNILKLKCNEQYVDLGAYDGDTIKEFLSLTNGYESITAFEPDVKNMKKLQKNVGSLPNCTLYTYASWSCACEKTFSGKGGRMSSYNNDGFTVQAQSVDNVCTAATYIKMDVEGAEYETLSGCKRIIEECRPKLAVSAYHRAGDIFTLPLFIHSLCPSYKIYLRHHKYYPSWETNLYCAES